MSQTKAQLLNPLGDFELTGQLVGVGATFSGNVSIAGTLTKQDVTNVDSVGLITARSGVNVTGGNVFIGQGGSGANNAELKLQAGAGTGNDIIAFLNQAGTTKGNITYDTDHNFLFFNTDGAERVRIGSSGLAQFKVDASKAAATQVRLENNAQVGVGTLPDIAVLGYASGGAQKASIRAAVYGEGWMSFHNNDDSEKMRLTAAGNLGIGKEDPSVKLDVSGAVQLTGNLLVGGGQALLKADVGDSNGLKLYQGASDTSYILNHYNGPLIFGTVNTERLRIDSSGKLLINHTASRNVGNITAQVQIEGTGSDASLSIIRNSNNPSSPYISLAKSRGGAVGGNTAIQDGDILGKILFSGADGTDVTNNSASISGAIDGTPGGNDTPGRLVFETTADGGTSPTERLRIGSAGQIGIAGANYGNAGQVLTSGGSGSAISWADAAGGAEFAGIASGSMSAGDPVIVNADGKLSKVGYSWAADLYPNPANDSNLVQPSSSAMQDYTVAVWGRNADGTFPAGTDPAVSFFYKSSSGGPSYRTSIVTNGTTNMAHEYSSGFNNGDSVGEFDVAWNPVATAAGGGGRLAAVFNRTGGGGGGYPAVQILRGPYSNGAWTQGGIQAMDSSAAAQGGISIAWHDANRWVTVYGQSGNYYGHVVTLTGSTSASVGSRTAVETGLATMSYRGHMTDKDDNGKHIVFYAAKTTGNRNSWRYSVVTVSGTSVSFGTPNWIGDDANPGLAIGDLIPQTSFDPDQNRFLVVYYKQTATNGGGAVNKIFARNAIISGTSVTWSAETQISAQNARGYDTVFDTNLKKHFVYLQDQSTNKVVYHLVNFTGSAAPSTSSEADSYSGSKELLDLGIDYDSTYGMIIVGGRKGNDGNNLAEYIQRTALSSSNLGDNNFVGFSKGNYTDGNTAKIGSLSALDENQTGLTTATTYYVKDDGTLSTTPSTPIVAAGHAVSSTNLIVKDATPRPGSLGHWTFVLDNTGSMKPWCVCGWNSSTGGIIGAYECANSSCRYCVGRWNPYCCIEDSVGSRYQWMRDLPTEGGGNMCLGCGGCCCCSQYYLERTCCCCWPTGRFWFPEVGMYCYNFNANMATCAGAPPSHGCWFVQTYFSVPMCRNRTCCNMFCQINGYQAYQTSMCAYCEPKASFDNVRLDGIVGVADTTKNWMSFAIMKSNMTNCVIVQNGICLINNACSGSGRQNKLTFQKISNDPLITYCN